MHRSEPSKFLLVGINSHNKIYLKRIPSAPAKVRARPRVLNEVGVTLRQNVGALTQVARLPKRTFYPFFLTQCSLPHEHLTLRDEYHGMNV